MDEPALSKIFIYVFMKMWAETSHINSILPRICRIYGDIVDKLILLKEEIITSFSIQLCETTKHIEKILETSRQRFWSVGCRDVFGFS